MPYPDPQWLIEGQFFLTAPSKARGLTGRRERPAVRDDAPDGPSDSIDEAAPTPVSHWNWNRIVRLAIPAHFLIALLAILSQIAGLTRLPGIAIGLFLLSPLLSGTIVGVAYASQDLARTSFPRRIRAGTAISFIIYMLFMGVASVVIVTVSRI